MFSVIPKPVARKVPMKKVGAADVEQFCKTCSNCGAPLQRGTGAKIVVQPSFQEDGRVWGTELVPLCGPCFNFRPNAAGGAA
jgi:hypothetical protein